jgi:DNA polymerase-3 subunit delta'
MFDYNVFLIFDRIKQLGMLFSDIAGQQSVKEHLVRTVREGRVSHAQLLAGGEGSGSLLLAVAYAQYLNCLDPGEADACGVCSSCVKAAKLVHPDIHFVFPVVKEGSRAVSDDHIKEWRLFLLEQKYFNAGQWFDYISGGKKAGMIYADESPEILRKLSMKNYEGKYKVMIIWLPERMNDTGSNKLLKILEEPPASTVFLLVSENPQSLLATILSRAQQLSVPPIETEALTHALSVRYSVSEAEARVAARLARGNYVKAVNNLDATKDQSGFFDLFGLLMRSTYSRKIFEIMRWVDLVAPLSRDKMKAYIDYSVGMLRESYIYNFRQPDLVYLTPMEEAFVQKFAAFITENNVEAMVSELQLAHAHIEQNGNARIILFDMAIKMVPMFNS